MLIHQDARVYASILDGEDRLQYALPARRGGYLHVARGSLTVNGQQLQAGDAVKIVNEPDIIVSDANDAEILLFDLPL